jgi:hypothetical protein
MKRSRWNEIFILPRSLNLLGIVLLGFVFLNRRAKTFKETELNTLLNHERIHVVQQLELLILPFFILYIGEWLVLLWKYKNINLAYRNISFEKEAYQHAENLAYIPERKPYAWFSYWR